jgi:hydroxyacylglutathione hydrolase
MRLAAALAASVLLAGCSVGVQNIQHVPRALVVTTPDVTRSMIDLARTDSGVVLIDLGWVDAAPTLRVALRRIGATPEEVTAVFLTHSHRDHIRAWRAVRGAAFHLAVADVPTFVGGAQHADLSSRVAARIFPNAYPTAADSLDLRPFSRDTFFALGGDTLRAFTVPGHTAGSAAYLFRGVLFVGDALSWSYLGGFRLAKRSFTRDWEENRASVASLWERVAAYRVDWVCTAHAKCARLDALVKKGVR